MIHRSVQFWYTRRGLRALCCLLLVLFWLSPVGALPLWQEEQQRLRVGLKLFPAVLDAQQELATKRRDDGMLEIAVVYRTSDQAARQAAAALEALDKVQDIPIAVSVLTVEQLQDNGARHIGAIFVASSGLEPELLRRLSEHHRVLVFSPFAGDVAAGAVAGIHVADRILPAINPAQAGRAGLNFKPFFLRVAHHAQ
ncbi:hypothetical protein F2Q65_14415 [Thiohalocapsa marina]|uniref:YfiR family protein n=1 Tax=Thiohalocapsa marina TaxID=424902 RepID=A0A5M8FGJ9_9GAMM|nr:hypothetical protein [Thiohalocapsa marina]KAA6183847.1 hypothetical protein F2Q65_14415 [Thiohalocapsa marina]